MSFSHTNISKEVYSDPNERNNFLRMMEESGYVKGYEYEVKRKGHNVLFDLPRPIGLRSSL